MIKSYFHKIFAITLCAFSINLLSLRDIDKSLLDACAQGAPLSEIKNYINTGADINCCSGDWYDGVSPLMYSLMTKKIDTVKYLIENGAEVNHVAYRDQPHAGFCPLSIAISCNSLELVNILIENKADVNNFVDLYYRKIGQQNSEPRELEPNIRNHYLLFFAIYCNASHNIIKALIDAGADIHATDIWGQQWTAIKLANLLKRHDIIQLLTIS